MSIQRTITRITERRVLGDGVDQNAAKHVVFSVVGWLSALYIANENADATCFAIDTGGSRYPSRKKVDIAKAQRPFDELIRACGKTMPASISARDQDQDHAWTADDNSRLRFQVSYLNAATLHELGRVQIVWVDTTSAHLDFDPTVPVLYLFRTPSFCQTQSSEESLLTL